MTDTKPTTAEVVEMLRAIAIYRRGWSGREVGYFRFAAEQLERIDALEAENARLTTERDELQCLLGLERVVLTKYREIFSELESHKRMNRDSAELDLDQTIFDIATPIIEKQKAELARLRAALEQYADKNRWRMYMGCLLQWAGGSAGPELAQRALEGRGDGGEE